MSRIILILIFLFSLVTIGEAKVYNMKEMMKAVVRIQSVGNYGSGTIFSESKTSYKIITNAHVVGESPLVKIDLFEDGKHIKRVDGKVVWKQLDSNRSIDLAIVSINKEDLGDYAPNVIKLAPSDTVVEKGNPVYSMGFPHARWPMGWWGEILESEDTLYFSPTPFAGQSGSAIFANIGEGEHRCTRIVGIIGWKTWEDKILSTGKLGGYGIAMHISVLYDLMGDGGNETDRRNVKARAKAREVGSWYWRNPFGVNISQKVWVHSKY